MPVCRTPSPWPLTLALAAFAAGCDTTPAPAAPVTPVTPIASANPTSSAAGAPPLGPVSFERVATSTNAGADACVTIRTELGALRVTDHPSFGVAFGPNGGIAAWDAPGDAIAVRPIDGLGRPTAPAISMSGQGSIYATVDIDGGFVVLTTALTKSDLTARAVDRNGVAIGPPQPLGLVMSDVWGISRDGARRVVVLAPPDPAQGLAARWIELTFDDRGALSQRTTTLALVRGGELLHARTADAAWIVRSETGPSSIVRRASVERADDAKLADTPTDESTIGYQLVIADPVEKKYRFERVAGGKRIGAPIDLAHVLLLGSMTGGGWSGAAFVFPTWDGDAKVGLTLGTVALRCAEARR